MVQFNQNHVGSSLSIFLKLQNNLGDFILILFSFQFSRPLTHNQKRIPNNFNPQISLLTAASPDDLEAAVFDSVYPPKATLTFVHTLSPSLLPCQAHLLSNPRLSSNHQFPISVSGTQQSTNKILQLWCPLPLRFPMLQNFSQHCLLPSFFLIASLSQNFLPCPSSCSGPVQSMLSTLKDPAIYFQRKQLQIPLTFKCTGTYLCSSCCCDLFHAHICRKCPLCPSILLVWRIIYLGVSHLLLLFCFVFSLYFLFSKGYHFSVIFINQFLISPMIIFILFSLGLFLLSLVYEFETYTKFY